MTVIKCKTCNGTGLVILKESHSEDVLNKYPKQIIDVKIQVTCYECGGSGCKWIEVNNEK